VHRDVEQPPWSGNFIINGARFTARTLQSGRWRCRGRANLFGPRARWGVIIGTMVATIMANLLGDRNLWSSVRRSGIALAVTVVPLPHSAEREGGGR
jgi:hypothetical protein